MALTFSGTPPAIKVNTILWGVSGEGYLRRVLSSSAAGNVLTLQTTQAYVTQAVKQGFFGVRRHVPTLQGARCVEQCQGVTVKPKENVHTTAGPELQLTINFPSIDVLQKKVKVSSSLELGLRIDEFALQIKPGANEFRLKQSFTVKLNLSAELEEATVSKEWPLGPRFSLGVIALGPFILVPDLEPTLVLGLSSGPEIKLDFGGTLAVQSYLLYQGGVVKVNATPTFNPVADLSLSQFKVGSVKLGFKPIFTLKLFGVAGPHVAPEAYGKASFSVGTKGSCAEVKGGLKVSLG